MAVWLRRSAPAQVQHSWGTGSSTTLFAGGAIVGLGRVSRSAVVCEDDTGLAVALRAVLNAHDVRILALLDRAALLAAAVREYDPDVVVIDAALLVTRGVDLLTELHASTSAALVVLCPSGLELSGFPRTTDVVPADDLAALHRLLERPFSRPGSGGDRQRELEGAARVDEVAAVGASDPACDG
ncbi:hypothetical protein [Pseudonocardia broussonetiae]|uniref:Response regulatory domain-containing protein n=1 Tax=Pseudonocardia broussonetiae TaxID=2736640 RepID=A0A6M6JPX9_9PSEU|nr:hypothetical protein [Pseudonocardia broussonetiae]QJY49037.1 hypothetical protein HOP40_27365 [Pseudonocardia broussonetiae]